MAELIEQEQRTRPSWHVIYMSMAIDLSGKSLDPRTRHGCFIVDKNYKPISFGFNSPPSGLPDEQIPLEAPNKYKYFLHAEENAILNADSISRLEGSTFYITGMPCSACFRKIRTVKAERIIYGPLKSAMIEQDAEEQNAINLLNSVKGSINPAIKLVRFHDLVGDYYENKAMQVLKNYRDSNWEFFQNKIGA